MTLSDIEIFAQVEAVLNYINDCLGTSFGLKQLQGKDFKRMQLYNAKGTVLLGPLELIDNVCVGLLALCNELNGR